ncbi:prolyl aminopeptidase [Alkalicaulis satelles]|uniref:Proline iminopeptidase n=1 Tax=Alkalicaulis satelles TaxID=2609175 RepID=A0A5M6ZA82_9PROT|nr:prolyl aminopeptidase [Alkalicaulis satelles]KAA5801020.1 prolyl aminopeptidase [Alkalicaulis satelles]
MDTHRNTRRLGLYAPLDPYRTGMLDVGEGHRLYFEECGRADGLPVVALHGGPGGGAAPAMRRFFDPRIYRIIIFDQRGCGRSTPHGEVRANDTPRLVADIEALRAHLGVDQWIVFGGSWGATLALAYARACREQVIAMALRGVFACTREEIDWFYRDGANRLFPDVWDRFTGRLSATECEDVLGAYHRRVMVEDVHERRSDVVEWARWESALISLQGDPAAAAPEPRRADALARMETHYFINGGFLERDGVLLEDTAHLADLPGVIVQGRYDMVTPARTAWRLSKAWPAARLDLIPDAGHAAGEPGIVDALVRAMDGFARRFA